MSGLKRLIYLLEGDLREHRNVMTGADMSTTFRTAEANTQAQVRQLCFWGVSAELKITAVTLKVLLPPAGV